MSEELISAFLPSKEEILAKDPNLVQLEMLAKKFTFDVDRLITLRRSHSEIEDWVYKAVRLIQMDVMHRIDDDKARSLFERYREYCHLKDQKRND